MIEVMESDSVAETGSLHESVKTLRPIAMVSFLALNHAHRVKVAR